MSSRSCSTRRAVRAGQHRLELVRVDQPPPTGAQHLAGVVVERLEPLGRRLLDRGHGAAADARVETYDDLVRRAVRPGHAAVRLHLLDAGAVRERGDLLLERGQLLDVRLDDRPDVHPDVVQVELRPVRALGARPADRLEAVLDRALGVRQRGDRPVRVAYDGELAHLRERDEPLVGRVVERRAVVEQHVLGRLEAGDRRSPAAARG